MPRTAFRKAVLRDFAAGISSAKFVATSSSLRLEAGDEAVSTVSFLDSGSSDERKSFVVVRGRAAVIVGAADGLDEAKSPVVGCSQM